MLRELPPGAQGFAGFLEDGNRRAWLERRWKSATAESPYVFWLGMNPSRAGAEKDDPTIGRLYGFTERLGLSRFIIGNVADIIATDPKAIGVSLPPSSYGNLDRIVRLAQGAAVVVVMTGDAPAIIRPLARHTVSLLRESYGLTLLCLGVTRKHDPKHCLYISGGEAIREYVETPNAL